MSDRLAERGVALLAVVWTVALLTVLAAAFTSTTRTETRLARNVVEQAQARAVAQAALHYVAFDLLRPVDQRRFPADGTAVPWTFAGFETVLRINDVAGRIDLNAADRETLSGVFEQAGVEAGDLDRVLDEIEDWRDVDDLRRLSGAEDEDYRAVGRMAGAKDAPFESVDELQQLLSVDARLVARVRDALTVYSGSAKVSASVVSPGALHALPGVDHELIDQYLEERAAAHRDGIEAPQVPVAGLGLSGAEGRAYIVEISARSPGGVKGSLAVTLMPGTIDGFLRTIEWREQGI